MGVSQFIYIFDLIPDGKIRGIRKICRNEDKLLGKIRGTGNTVGKAGK